MPRAKSDAVPAGRRDCLPAPPGAGVAGCQVGERAGRAVPRAKPDAVPAGRRDCLPAPPGAGAANGEQKRHADAEKTNAFGLWRAEGKRKNLRLAGNQRQDRRKRHDDAEKADSYCLWRAGGEKENLRLAENRRKCRRKIIRWRIGFGTAGRRNRPFPAAADDCPAR